MSSGTTTCTIQNNYQDPVLGPQAVLLGGWPLTEYTFMSLQVGQTSGINYNAWIDWLTSNGTNAQVLNGNIFYVSQP
jgi:hypothetical protein